MKLARNLLLALACTSNLVLVVSLQASILASPSAQTSPAKMQSREIEVWEIQQKARQNIVRVSLQNNAASGILIARKQINADNKSIYNYLVVTNNHVILHEKDFHIEAPDGRVYKAYLHPESKERFSDNRIDLALLYFSSPTLYETAILGNSSSVKDEDDVFIAGFACQGNSCDQKSEFIFLSGVTWLLKKPLVDGYQLGFTSETRPGTSGGVVFNNKGDLVAINGRGKYPILNHQYEYADGSKPSRELQKTMRYFAWSIPINTYKKFAPQAPFDKIEILNDSIKNIESSSENISTDNNIVVLPSSNDKLINWQPILVIVAIAVLLICISWWIGRKIVKEQDKDKKGEINQEIHPQTSISQRFFGIFKSQQKDSKELLEQILQRIGTIDEKISFLETESTEFKESLDNTLKAIKTIDRNISFLDTKLMRIQLAQVAQENFYEELKIAISLLKHELENKTELDTENSFEDITEMKTSCLKYILLLSLITGCSNTDASGSSNTPKSTSENSESYQNSPIQTSSQESDTAPLIEQDKIQSEARKQTVLITGKGTGTGIIIGKDGYTHYVLTSHHVVAVQPSKNINPPSDPGPDEPNQPTKEDPYKVVTYDGQAYEVDEVLKDPKYDLAVIKFNTENHGNRKYPVAKLASHSLSNNQTIYVYGFKDCFGEGREKREEFNQGTIRSNSKSINDDKGYTINYTNPTVNGMSGSPVLDASGRVVAIHGQSGTPGKGNSPNCSALTGDFGNNYGISMETFKNSSLASQVGVELAFDEKPLAISMSTNTKSNNKQSNNSSDSPKFKRPGTY
ncbi:hypothetical protein AMR41_10215 [Hapalosiphon sp. MRB220]|nr:hypothetical protein AMR41_10215 [Hapalosiphon sp. MRB220]